MRGIVPDTILDRRDKMGYVTPNNQWISKIKDPLKAYFTSDLEQFIDTKQLLKDYDQLFSPKGTVDTGRVFKYISFAIWMKRLIKDQL
jgi:asparagine synthase (glutamine-hydrolysing)